VNSQIAKIRLKYFIGVSALVLSSLFLSSGSESNDSAFSKDPFLWIEPSINSKPWSYWWWMGSAVDEKNIAGELTTLQKAGWGGVHIVPIYGAKGWENKYIKYLSPEWLKMLDFTVNKAKELGLQIDMTLGTGWCFGGPTLSDEDANARVFFRTNLVNARNKFSARYNKQKIQAIMAYDKDGKCVDLTQMLKDDGSIEWQPGQGDWTVYALWQQPSGQKVKRPAPGGEGYMLNLIYPHAVSNYLKWFDNADYKGALPRAVYHDSYEYRSDWSPDFLEKFFKRKGYKLQEYLPYFFRHINGEISKRIITDYRETVSDIMIEESIPLWIEWSHKKGLLTRNEAHGSPANLLDLYALADIPETEMFYRDRNVLISKLASSSAHISGKQLTSAETGTWLKEHFNERLMDIKELIDQMFVSGVNHIIFHGTCYSPDEAPWPGWVFYASTQLNPRNPIWRDVSALSQYISRCQSILQSGKPCNDILLYYPFYDVWQKLDGLLPHFTIHGLNWFDDIKVSKVATYLWPSGFSFDYISDRQLKRLKYSKDSIISEGNAKYQVLIIPECDYMTDSTLKEIIRLASEGATIIFEKLPADVPGFYDLQKRRGNFQKLLKQISLRDFTPNLKIANVNNGKIYVGEMSSAIQNTKITPHFIKETGTLEYVARETEWGFYSFLVNHSDKVIRGWYDTGWKVQSAVLMNPYNGESGIAQLKESNNTTYVYLELEPLESCILRLFKNTKVSGPSYKFWDLTSDKIPINGEWKVEFIEGGPMLPPSKTITNLTSITQFDGDDCKRFSGTVKYTIKFNLNNQKTADGWFIDLGEVCQSAKAKLNGKELGTVYTKPFRLVCTGLKPSDNILEVEATTLAANRIRDMDRRKVQWKYFNDINIVNINYKPFDASNWELVDAGLIGPVNLIPAKIKTIQ